MVLWLESLPLTVTDTTRGNTNYNSPSIPPLRIVTGWGNDPSSGYLGLPRGSKYPIFRSL